MFGYKPVGARPVRVFRAKQSAVDVCVGILTGIPMATRRILSLWEGYQDCNTTPMAALSLL